MPDTGSSETFDLTGHPLDLLAVFCGKLPSKFGVGLDVKPLKHFRLPKQLVVDDVGRELFEGVNQVDEILRFGLLRKAFTQETLLDVLDHGSFDREGVPGDFVEASIVLKERVLPVGGFHNFSL